MSITVVAPITDVTVYVSYARVTRRGKVQLEAGEHTLVLSPITPQIESDSVRAGGRGAGITIRSVDVKTDYQVVNPQAEIEALKNQKQDLMQTQWQLKDEVKSLDKKIELLEKFGADSGKSFAKAIAQDTVSLDNVANTLDYIAEQSDLIRTLLRENGLKQAYLERDIKAITQKLGNLQNNKTSKIHEIHIIVDIEAPVEFEFEVSYTVQGATWKPVYDLRLIDDDVTLTYLATVQQTTSEDWEGIDLSLSTARPASSTQLPTVDPWYIPMIVTQAMRDDELATIASPQAWLEQLVQEETAYTMPTSATYMDSSPVIPSANVPTVTVSTDSPTAVTYNIAGTVDIPSDGTPHQTTIIVTNLGVELDYFTAPRLGSDCYLRAVITNTSAYVLLPGIASIFHEGDFVGKTAIQMIASDEDFEVQLGVDDRIRVEREMVKRNVSKKLIGSNKKITYEYEISIISYLDKPTKIKIVEPYPKSTTTNIKVNLLNVSPQPDEESELNVLTWETELDPQQEFTISLSFVVESAIESIRNLD